MPDTDTPIRPALTPEEWEVRSHFGPVSAYSYKHVPDKLFFGEDSDEAPAPNRHALAALCLYGQPFGFTHEDVAILREAALEARARHREFNDEAEGDARRDAVNTIADRLAALLPPK